MVLPFRNSGSLCVMDRMYFSTVNPLSTCGSRRGMIKHQREGLDREDGLFDDRLLILLVSVSQPDT